MLKVKCRWGLLWGLPRRATRQTPPPASDDKTGRSVFVCKTSRLEYLLEFPKGKVLARFEKTDIFRAKDILKGHLCIEGNVPSSILQMATVDDVKIHCKNLLITVERMEDISCLLGVLPMRSNRKSWRQWLSLPRSMVFITNLKVKRGKEIVKFDSYLIE